MQRKEERKKIIFDLIKNNKIVNLKKQPKLITFKEYYRDIS
jgi:hypothetical protein